MVEYIDGNLITLAKEGYFDVIAHGCNCFNVMGSGIALQMKREFFVNEMPLEQPKYKGYIDKLGCIEYHSITDTGNGLRKSNPNDYHIDDILVTVVNAYTQYHYGRYKECLDYEALTLCMRKINFYFGEQHIGLPKIGSGLAGGDWSKIEAIIDKELKDCKITVVNYKP